LCVVSLSIHTLRRTLQWRKCGRIGQIDTSIRSEISARRVGKSCRHLDGIELAWRSALDAICADGAQKPLCRGGTQNPARNYIQRRDCELFPIPYAQREAAYRVAVNESAGLPLAYLLLRPRRPTAGVETTPVAESLDVGRSSAWPDSTPRIGVVATAQEFGLT